MKKNHFRMLIVLMVMALFTLSCENSLEILLPQGPKGEKGDKGDPGKSAFELWLEFYEKDPSTPIEDFFDSLKGKDGADGAVPIIGSNDHWFIDGVDTGIPARGKDGKNGVTPVIGDNDHWFIDGVDTGIPARGKDGADGADGADGVDGKSAYELWKIAVDNGDMTNKDGSEYTGGNTWEDFLIWLQGGDVSVLHRYWITLPGNEDKTIREFIEELFDCHCDGITVSVFYVDECVELNPDGTLKETYDVQLRVGGTGGTRVHVSADGVNLNGTITDDTTPLVFTIPRGDKSVQLTVTCTLDDDTITKQAVIPALNYLKLTGEVTVTAVDGEQKDVVEVTFATAPVELSVDGTKVYEEGNVVGSSGWAVSNEGKTFTRTYDRMTTEQKPTVQATGDNDACSTIEEAFTIPQMTPVDLGELNLDIIDNCFLSLTVNGTSGMTVTAMHKENPANFVVLTEDPVGTYTASVIPRTYDAYTILVIAEMDGRGTVEKEIEVEGTYLAPVSDPLTISQIDGMPNNTSTALVRRRFTNNTDAPLVVRVTRTANSASGANQHPDFAELPITGIIQANAFIDFDFYRDYTGTLADGSYELVFTTKTECDLEKTYRLTIDNLENYRHTFTLMDGWNSGNGDPDDRITFEVSLFDGIPDSFVELQLYNGTAYEGVSREQLDAGGNGTWTFSMTRAGVEAALDNKTGFFYFFPDDGYINKYSIGAGKEEITFEF